MKRSEFLKSFGLASAGLILPNTNNVLSHKPIKIYDNYVKGVHHYPLHSILPKIKVGEPLLLYRDLENKYDRFAIRVLYNSHKIGYIAAYENIVLANLMDYGADLFAFVSKRKHHTKYQAISVEIYTTIVLNNSKVIPTDLLEKRADDAEDIYRAGGFGSLHKWD